MKKAETRGIVKLSFTFENISAIIPKNDPTKASEGGLTKKRETTKEKNTKAIEPSSVFPFVISCLPNFIPNNVETESPTAKIQQAEEAI
jgi:hypothetical protein